MSSNSRVDALPPEEFVHEPTPAPPYWQESCFFVTHQPGQPRDVLLLSLTSHPSRRSMDCHLMTRVDGRLQFARFARRYTDADRTTAVGATAVRVMEPYRRIAVSAGEGAPVPMHLEWTPRTAPCILPPGSVCTDGRLVWEQEHLFQSGRFDGWYDVGGERRLVDGWWGQRDHSWGVRDHGRTAMWMWLAIQLPDGMFGVWCWEQPDGTRAYCHGLWAEVDDPRPVPLEGFEHRLEWLDEDGRGVGYGRRGEGVAGLGGTVRFDLPGARSVTISGQGRWSARYGRRGGGQNHLTVVTDDGRTGSAIYEITGSRHHRYFPGSGR